MLLLMRRYLQAGIMEGGVTLSRSAGMPQGGPLSPLLSNILLDELDKELETRGHRFVRYERAWPVVARRGKPYEPGIADPDAARRGLNQPAGGIPPTGVRLTNRRMPNGTSGGVASRAGQPARLPDCHACRVFRR